MRRFARIAEMTALCLVLTTAGGGVSAQETEFGGFTIGAVAAGQSWTYNQPSAGIPASPTGEMNQIYTQAELDTGPRGYGLASLAWPGQTAANAPGFAYGQFPPEFRDQFPLKDPTYPVRAETFHPQGPESQRTEPGGGMRMRSTATGDFVDAAAAADQTGFEGLVTFGSQTSRTTSEITDGLAIAEGAATASEISFFGGFITIDQVRSKAVATSDGTQGKVGGSVAVSGMEIDGHPVRIDGTGIHIDGNDIDPGVTAAKGAVQQALAQAGIEFALADPIDTVEGPSASRSIGGLIVRISSESFKEYAQQLPAPIRDELARHYDFDQTTMFSIASVAASSAATIGSPFDFGFGFDGNGGSGSSVPPSSGTTTFQEFGTGGGDGTDLAGGTSSVQVPDAAPSITEPAEPTGGRAPVSFPIGFDGVPFFLVAGALLLAAGAARWLARGADAILGAAAAPANCPYEDLDG